MAPYLCQNCNRTVSYGENHQCIFSKHFDNVSSQSQLDELDARDIKHNEVKDEFITNSIDITRKICPTVQRDDNEECKQINSVQSANNETVSFIPASREKRKYSTSSDETYNKAQRGNPPDTLLLSSISNTSANEVYFEECASFKGCLENFKIDYRSESGFPGVYKRKSSTTGVISEQNKSGSNVSSLIHAASHEESEISIKESEWHSFNKDKKIFLESLELAINNARLVSKNISEYSNSLLKSDLSPRNKESDELSRELTDGPISHDVTSQLSSRNEEMAVNVMETPDTSENENVIAGPSGIRACLLKQAEKKGFVCGLCHKDFAESWEFDIHYRTHTGEKPFMCEVCKRGFTQEHDLKRHYRTHTGENPFVCDICKKGFAHSVTLNDHYRIHTGENSFVCDMCQKGFAQKSHLRIHYRTHTAEKPFVCNICQKGFIRRVHLDNHHRIHSGEKPFVCKVCKRGFTQEHDLKRHYRTHTGEKPFVCDICQKRFCLKGNLKKHHRTHTGEKPFECEVCKKGFADRSNLARHAQKHTGEKRYE
ncbi:Histone-lysine N-methyltransferase PRDM9 [Araneus ventricosus]|uniref:Histone-lysine N-methyltransferase PRDM9 n=1 Tax=Araneus ventricosus TaxID=182803 RepID=A0A4Y2PY39_ARAVE|nr:Histone-lysine N-methyltransferase PRDM9 [Araneus ventricosus]